ncbi:MAG: Vms1/Ankzf1 family peptidyl-tRNA hydrolase [Haloferacaceae archaeon]
MIDDLLGRTELKERIEELREERDSYEAQLAAERERRAEASSARQDAEERVNRLEDRVTELEDRVERAEGVDEDRGFARVDRLGPSEREAVLGRLRSVESAPETLLTAMVVEPGDVVRDAFGDRAPLVARAAPCLALTDDHGVVRAALDPPFPPEPFVTWGERFRLDASWFEPPARHAVALVRADRFALGVYEGDERVDLTALTADVEENHSKGGFSQSRYERRRDEQIAAHHDRAREALADVECPLVLTGDRASLDALSDVDAAATRTVDASGDPEDALAAARRDALSTGLYVL